MQEQALIDRVTLTNENDIPTFTFITSQYDKLEYLFSNFPLAILPIDVPTFLQLPLPNDVKIPADASLRLEFSLDDVNAGMLLWDLHLSANERQTFSTLNHQSRSIRIIVKGSLEKQIHLFDVKRPYILDWSGMSGLALYLRTTLTQAGRDWEISNAKDILRGMEDILKNAGGYITNFHSQMGLIHRYLGQFGEAKKCYKQEIKGASREDGTFAQSAMSGFNNLAVIHKKEEDYKQAMTNFQYALALNPNYFEALVSIAGIMTDQKTATEYIIRAYRIQHHHPIWNTLIHNMAQGHGQPPQNLFNYIQNKAQDVDLESTLFSQDILKDVKLD